MNFFKIVPSVAEYLVYKDVVKDRFVAVTPENMIEARKLRLIHKGTYRDVPNEHYVYVIPVVLDASSESAGIDESRQEKIPVNHLEIAVVHLRH